MLKIFRPSKKIAREWSRRNQGAKVELKTTGQPPTLGLPEGKKFHLFLSHTWKTGQDQVAVIKRHVREMLPESTVFLGAPTRPSLPIGPSLHPPHTHRH